MSSCKGYSAVFSWLDMGSDACGEDSEAWKNLDLDKRVDVNSNADIFWTGQQFTASERSPIEITVPHECFTEQQSEPDQILIRERGEGEQQVRWPNFSFLFLIISRFLPLHPSARPRCERTEAASPML